MNSKIDIANIVFLDIETVPKNANYSELDKPFKDLWDKKAKWLIKDDESPEDLYQRAGIYAEFGKIICICLGIIDTRQTKNTLRLKSIFGDDEKKLLEDFIEIITKASEKKEIILCAHNGKEFDFPYLARRILINGLKLPEILNIGGKKPWEINHLDTMELWKFGDYKHYTSLELLTAVFGIPSPKEDIDGSEVHDVYWKDKDINRIVRYCENDVISIVQIFLRYQGLAIINEENILRPD